jgi:hypothetical protein
LVEAGRHQDAIAQPIDQPRQAARVRLNLINGVCGERRPVGRADAQAVALWIACPSFMGLTAVHHLLAGAFYWAMD